MSIKQSKTRVYVKPEITVLKVDDNLLADYLSSNGGHNKSKDDEQPLNAKRWQFDEDELEDESTGQWDI